jgi:hypothetical protein
MRASQFTFAALAVSLAACKLTGGGEFKDECFLTRFTYSGAHEAPVSLKGAVNQIGSGPLCWWDDEGHPARVTLWLDLQGIARQTCGTLGPGCAPAASDPQGTAEAYIALGGHTEVTVHVRDP